MKRVSGIILAIGLVVSLALPAFAAEERIASDPGASVERGAAIQTLYEREGSPVVIQSVAFDDTAGKWYANAAVWAKGAGIASGDADGHFDGDRAVTRAELAAMLYRYVQTKGMGFTGMWAFRMDYPDVAEVPEWAHEATAWCVMKGVMTADASGKLASAAAVSRAELADMLSRLARVISEETSLSLWTSGAAAKNELLEYMAAITDESSADYIPAEDRIAVFDLDGTLFCETDPNYFDYTLLKYRVLEDPTYKDKASDFEKEVANKIKEQNETGKSFSGLEVDHGKAVASAFAGMTVGEFNAYIQEFKKQPMPSYNGMLRGDGWYAPMLQVVNFLKENDFTVYVVSGTDRLIVRGIAYNSPLGLPNGQIIGSDETIVSNHQDGKDGLNYLYSEGDKLVLGGNFLIKNLKMNKVAVIAQEIGQQPVLSFGNSSGDASMANYVIHDNPHRAAAFMLCCDDLVRENGNTEKAESMRASCEKNGWTPISMRDDWTTIYGEGVTRIAANAEIDPS